MKFMYATVLSAAPLFVILLGCSTQPVTTTQATTMEAQKDQQPRFAARLIICAGKSKASSCDGGLAKAEGPLKVLSGALTCGHPGAVSKVSWRFIEHRTGKDIYEFTRVFPEGEPNAVTTTITSGFSGEKTTLFEDANQVVLIELAIGGSASNTGQPQSPPAADQPGG